MAANRHKHSPKWTIGPNLIDGLNPPLIPLFMVAAKIWRRVVPDL